MPRVSVFGASARAACASLRRAGIEAWAADRFDDADLSASARVVSASGNWPERLCDAIEATPRGQPWIYSGALENHPELVSRMERRRPLLGCPAEVLARVRDPFRLARAVPMPELSRAPPPKGGGEWLLKPYRSAGGAGVRLAAACVRDDRANVRSTASAYWQRRVDGESRSALFVATRRGARFVGATLQLAGVPWLGAADYLWCGNVAPLSVSSAERRELCAIAWTITSEMGLTGVFGIDYIRSGEPHAPRISILECNPRYPASLELFEFAARRPLIGLHIAAASRPDATLPALEPIAARRLFARGVLYARRDIASFPIVRPRTRSDRFAFPRWADIPAPDRRIAAGEPIFSLYASGSSPESCVARLRRTAARCVSRLESSGDEPRAGDSSGLEERARLRLL